MPKLTIGKENFQDVDAYTGKVYLRYRIVSEDRNRSSYYSPIFEIDPPVYYVQGLLEIPGGIIGTKNTGYVTLAWDSVSIYDNDTLSRLGELQSYDIWIQYGGNGMSNAGPWIYKERVFTTSISLVTPPTYGYIDSNGISQTATTRQIKVEIHRNVNPLIRYSPDRFIFPQWFAGVDLVNDKVTTLEPHGLITGDALGYYSYNPSSVVSPLADGQVYWARVISQNEITLHTSEAGAIANTGKVNLTAYGQGVGVFAINPFLQSTSINITTDVVTLPYEHKFKIGESVIYNALTAASPLVKETLYFVRPISNFEITLHPTRADAIKNTRKIDLTNTGSGYGTLVRFFSLFYKTQVVNL